MEEALKPYHCPRWAELPSLPLYMDQVVIVISTALSAFAAGDETVVTPAMINNYVKQKLVDPPEKKKYGKQQLTRLIVLTLFKRVFSMNEIAQVISWMSAQHGMEVAYDMFCERLETYVNGAFFDRTLKLDLTGMGQEAKDLMDTALVALVCKLVVQNGIAAGQADVLLAEP